MNKQEKSGAEEKLPFETLNGGHEQMTEELANLLNFNIQKLLERLKKEYDYFVSKGLSEEELEDVEIAVRNLFEKECDIKNYSSSKVWIRAVESFLLKIVKEIKDNEITEIESLSDGKKKIKEACTVRFGKSGTFGIGKVEPSDRGLLGVRLASIGIASDLPITEVFSLIEFLPEDLQSLDISNNGFEQYSAGNYKRLVELLPRELLRLNISWNSILGYPSQKVQNIMKVLPENLKILDISFLDLFHYPVDELKNIFLSFPLNIKSLNLSGNEVFAMKPENVGQISGFLSRGLMELKMDECDMSGLDAKHLKQFISQLPSGLRLLSLEETGLGKFSKSQLKDIFSVLPEEVSVLNLRENNLEKYTRKDLNLRDNIYIPGIKD